MAWNVFSSKWISSDGLTLWAVFSGLGAFDLSMWAQTVLGGVNNKRFRNAN